VPKIKLTAWQLSLCAAFFIVCANNSRLFAAFGQELDVASAEGLGFVLAIVLLATFVVTALLLAFGVGRLLKPLIVVFLIATSIFGYFSNEMGVIFHEEMFLNIFETVRDSNSAEATELASLPLLMRVFFAGVLPSLALGFVDVVHRPFFREAGTRLLVAAALFALFIGVAMPNFKFVTYFAVEHRELRFTVMPVFPIMSLVRLARNKLHHEPPFSVIDADARQRMVSANRTVGIMVVGETARADHFSLNGYGKITNPLLAANEDVLFADGRSCGTSTLFSVPCMFSIKGHDSYSESDAKSESNELDILSAAGVRTVWIDNNSSCKHACDRIENINLRRALDESSPYFSDMGYFDEILLDRIDGYLSETGPDLLIVLHTLGSHGPAYSRRYPASFGIFAPYCDKASPKECSNALVSNAYDNTIVYTDYILSRLIAKLDVRKDKINGFLFYASDHGESLGENGIYLHGLPYALAPEAQKDVPFIAWLSPGLRQSRGIDVETLGRFSAGPVSHDNISHTLMGFYDVNALSYQQELDLFAHL
jgi:lipid A ethanolaminephosphotransferase